MMIRHAFFLGLLLLSPSTLFGTSYWACTPQQAPTQDPRVAIIKGTEANTALFWFENDWVRKEGTLPKGQYEGILQPSESGFSVFAKLNVDKYFPNTLPNGKGSWIWFPLSIKSSVFVSEAYLLWYKHDDSADGMILNMYGCRAKSRTLL